MPPVLYRVDNRLVHGQVLEGWVPRLGADAILVVDDDMATDSFKRCIIEGMSYGEALLIKIVETDKALEALRGEFASKKTIVLFHNIEAVKLACDAGLSPKSLNLGNLHPKPESASLTNSVNLSDGEMDILLELAARAIALEARAVPSDVSPDVVAFCKKGREARA